GGDSAYDYGVLLQAGYMLNDKWEVFGRYDVTKLDGAVAFTGGGSEDTFHELIVGVNYYIHSYNAKFTVDASYLPSGSPNDQVGLGYLAGGDAQFVVRG